MVLNLFSVWLSTILFQTLIRRSTESGVSIKVYLFSNKIAASCQKMFISKITLIRILARKSEQALCAEGAFSVA